MYKVVLLGAALNTGNMGVSALCNSLLKIISTFRPDAEFYLLIGSRGNGTDIAEQKEKKITVNIVNYRLSPKARLSEHLFWILFLAVIQRIIPVAYFRKRIIESSAFLRTICESDFVGDIHGGDSFSDIYGYERFLTQVIPDFIAILLGKKLILLPQTYGPFNSELSRRVSGYLIRKADKIYSRDTMGVKIIEQLAGENTRHAIFCPDVAFVLDSVKPDNAEASVTKKLIGINVSGLLYRGGYSKNNMFKLRYEYKDFVILLSKYFLENTDYEVLLIPHTVTGSGHIEDDLSACNDVKAIISDGNASGKVHVAAKKYKECQIKGLIGTCDFFIGSRMHACIAALSQGIPTMSLAYSRKFQGVFDSIGMGGCVIDATVLDLDQSLELVKKEFQNKDEIKVDLLRRSLDIQKLIFEIFEENFRN